ncbi:hypothetical protein ACWD4V_33980 [Streptomyces tsukubensis]|uniref:hypothetical protein n=1 Tax=Streptomyces tsukubensis TaxID=83656 RepID=UPI0036965FC4
MLEVFAGLSGVVVLLGTRLAYQWIRGRTEVELARVSRETAAGLPPGSVLTDRRPGSELRVQIGPGLRGQAHD